LWPGLLTAARDRGYSYLNERLAALSGAVNSRRMFIYSVTVTIEPAIEREWLDWMRRTHVPDVLRTGCFTGATIYKMFEATSDEQTYVIQYQCSAMAEYHRYRDHFATAVQKEHSDRFSGRFRASRQILEEV
jgi:uncharacterized protein DUF4286